MAKVKYIIGDWFYVQNKVEEILNSDYVVEVGNLTALPNNAKGDFVVFIAFEIEESHEANSFVNRI